MLKRKSRERKVEHNKFKIKYGIVDIDRPQSVFFEMTSFVSPKEEKGDYKKSASIIKKKITKVIKSLAEEGDLFDQRFVFIYDTATDYYEVDKKSYLFIQGVMRQKSVPPRPFNEIDKDTCSFVDRLSTNIYRIFTEEGYTCTKTKSS